MTFFIGMYHKEILINLQEGYEHITLRISFLTLLRWIGDNIFLHIQ